MHVASLINREATWAIRGTKGTAKHTCRQRHTERATVGTALDVRVDGEFLGILVAALQEELHGGLVAILGSEMERSPALRKQESRFTTGAQARALCAKLRVAPLLGGYYRTVDHVGLGVVLEEEFDNAVVAHTGGHQPAKRRPLSASPAL